MMALRRVASVASTASGPGASTAAAAAAGAAGAASPTVRRVVGAWWVGLAGMCYGAIVIGGVTRLTESGLSMVDWDIIRGIKPPRTQEEWEAAFGRYQEFPEYKISNKDMTLEEFKFIFHMEYGHRMWGRAIGLFFLLPVAAFAARGWLSALGASRKVAVVGAMIGGQGLLGWYMVKSGLDERNFQDAHSVPRVSQYRLAAHLGAAFAIYAVALWNGMQLLLPTPAALADPRARLVRKLAHSTAGLVFFTVLSGALVAGLDAGLVYNTWPKMADRWVPTDILAHSPWYRNFTENATTVQFDHRVLGQTTFLLTSALWLAARRAKLSPRARLASHAVLGLACVQVTLGISTLLHFVPVHLAASHQAGAVALFSGALWLLRELPK